jgi:hypothetical protein
MIMTVMRKIKPVVLSILEHPNFDNNLQQIHELPAQKSINVLFSFLCSADKSIKNKAVIAMGEVVSRMAETDLESARTVMRRLIWSLNEESGWIGWGSAEALGEIMARNEILAEEYHNLLISFVTEGNNNYLLFDKLREEVIQGLIRLSQVHPHLVQEVQHLLKKNTVRFRTEKSP